MNVELHREKQRIENIFSLVERLPAEEEILSHWARYLCVMTSGLLENAMRIMLSDFARRHANPRVTKFAQQHIGRLQNLNEERLKQVLGSFDAEWRRSFEAMVTDAHKAAIDSVVDNRNSIAHGLPVGITIARMRGYYNRIVEVVDWIRDNCVQ